MGASFFLPPKGLTRLQEAFQVYWADKLLPVVGPVGHDAQQLLRYNNAQHVGQVGFIYSRDEEWATWLHTGSKNGKVWFMKYKLNRLRYFWKHISWHLCRWYTREELFYERQQGIYRMDLRLSEDKIQRARHGRMPNLKVQQGQEI